MDLDGWLTVACLLAILAEWSYVLFWTRTAGRSIVSGVLRKVGTLRTGRGQNDTATETLAAVADGMPAGELDSTALAELAGRFGIQVSPEEVDSFLKSNQGALGAADGMAGAPMASLGAPPSPTTALLGQLAQQYVAGGLTKESIAPFIPALIAGLARGSSGEAQAASGGGAYWG